MQAYIPQRIDAMARSGWTTALLLAVCTAACGGGGAPGDAAGSGPGRGASRASGTGEAVRGEVRVSAAASLTDAFEAVALAFDKVHPGVHVVLNLGGSSSLRVQILEGAPVDAFASADTANMHPVVDAGLVAGTPSIFARNRLQIAVPPGNPAGVRGLDSFGDDALRIGLCARGVPCGNLARRALARAGVTPAPDTEEPDVRALLTKIELGELDAGIVYATDVASSRGRAEGIDIPTRDNVSAAYPIAVLDRAPNPVAARAFVAFVLSKEGRAILGRFGFASP